VSNDSTVTGDDAGDTGTSGDDSGDAGTGPTQPPCASGQVCVDQIPSGWSGYVQLVVAAADAGSAPSCADPYGASQATGMTNPVGAPADCSSCTTCLAGDAGPVTCTVQIGQANYGCLGASPATPANQNACTPVGGTNGNANGEVSAPTVGSAAGTCAPAAAPAAPSAPAAVACALTNDGGAPDAGDGGAAAGPTCASTQACSTAITAPAGSPSGVCVYKSGVQTSCPPGHFSDLHVVGSSIADTRGCGCSCANPTCPTDGYVTGYASSDCSGAVAVTLDAGTGCKFGGVNIHNAATFIYHPSHGTFTGMCPLVDAGQPSGGVSVDPTGATTYCCIP
jgi:hypothetical protein